MISSFWFVFYAAITVYTVCIVTLQKRPRGEISLKYGSIGRNIKKYRIERKMRQEDLAEKTGLSTNYIGMIERGEKIPSLETLIDIMNVLRVSADMVLYEELATEYTIKNSLLTDKMATLSERDCERVNDVVGTMVRFKG